MPGAIKYFGYFIAILVFALAVYFYNSPRIQETVKGTVVSANSLGIEIQSSSGALRFLPITADLDIGEDVEILVYQTPFTKETTYRWYTVSSTE
tara:strand:- start:271 stop:552 length:282 start_codon:yes stop_codon:yes gene_type:complete